MKTARESLLEWTENKEFDCAVLSTYDTSSQHCDHWYAFAGHPETYTAEDLNHMAKMMSESAVKTWEGHAPEKVCFGPIKKLAFSGIQLSHDTVIGQIGIARRNRRDRFWIALELMGSGCYLGYTLVTGTNEDGIQYKSLRIGLGPFSLRFIWNG